MNLLEIIDFRDKLKADLAIVERFIEIAKARDEEAVVPPSASSSRAPTPTTQPEIPGIPRDYGNLSDVVREAIKLCADRYTVNDVFKTVTKLGKGLTKLQVATVLSRLSKTGELEIHQKGKGSNPTVFRKFEHRAVETAAGKV